MNNKGYFYFCIPTVSSILIGIAIIGLAGIIFLASMGVELPIELPFEVSDTIFGFPTINVVAILGGIGLLLILIGYFNPFNWT